MKNKCITLFLMGIFILSGCQPKEKFTVEHRGALMDIIHGGDYSAKITLKELENREHLYALGALENMKGEILVLDSKPFVTTVDRGVQTTENTFSKSAALLVWARVKEWREVRIPSGISSYTDLETFIEKTAKESNIDTELPFPFLLKGRVAAASWHVLNWDGGEKYHSHEDMVSSGLHGKIDQATVNVLGFFSKHSQGVFTHHSTMTHMHVKTMDDTIIGHMDDITLDGNMSLLLPG